VRAREREMRKAKAGGRCGDGGGGEQGKEASGGRGDDPPGPLRLGAWRGPGKASLRARECGKTVGAGLEQATQERLSAGALAAAPARFARKGKRGPAARVFPLALSPP